MAPSIEHVRVRLLQVRDHPEVAADERASFLERTGLRPNQLLSASILTDPIDERLLDGVDAVLIGGASGYSATRTYAWTAPLIRLCHQCAERDLPLFGSCWGHQLVARAFGGHVVHDPDRAELGTQPITLTDAGKADALFGELPPTVFVHMGHHDRVSELPPGALELASSAVTPFQAFRLAGAPVYGTQFHSELDAAPATSHAHLSPLLSRPPWRRRLRGHPRAGARHAGRGSAAPEVSRAFRRRP